MKRIEFKRISKELIKEGITIDLLNKVQNSGKLSPVMFQKGDEPVNLVRCNPDFYWVLLDDGAYLKDTKGLMKFDIKTCIIARARYLINYKDIEIKNEIELEKKRIENELTKTVGVVIENYETMKRWDNGDFFPNVSGINFMAAQFIYANDENRKEWETECKIKAKQFFTKFNEPGIGEFVSKLKTILSNNDFDSLYMVLKTNGLPLLMSAKYDDKKDIDLMLQFFHKDNIDKTAELLNAQSHIENIAMFNVNKRYI